MTRFGSLLRSGLTIFALLILAPVPLLCQKLTKEQKAANAALKQKLEAQLAQTYTVTTFKKSPDRYGTKAVIAEPGTVLYVEAANFLPGTDYIAATKQQTDTGDNTGKLAASAGILDALNNALSNPFVPKSPACDKFTTFVFPQRAKVALDPQCPADIAAGNAVYLDLGQPVLLAGLQVDPAQNAILVTLLDHHMDGGVFADPQFLAHFSLKFTDGTIQAGDAAPIVKTLQAFFTKDATKANSIAVINQVKATYKVGKYKGNPVTLGNHITVTEPGAIVRVAKSDLLIGVNYLPDPAHAGQYIPATKLCENDETVELPTATLSRPRSPECAKEIAEGRAVTVSEGEKLTVMLVSTSNSKKDAMVVVLLSYKTDAGGTMQPPALGFGVTFHFPEGFLATATADQIIAMLSNIIPLNVASATPSAPAASSIDIGMTPDQVIAALGQPQKKVTAGTKIFFVYDSLKVTFLNGKVTSVQ